MSRWVYLLVPIPLVLGYLWGGLVDPPHMMSNGATSIPALLFGAAGSLIALSLLRHYRSV